MSVVQNHTQRNRVIISAKLKLQFNGITELPTLASLRVKASQGTMYKYHRAFVFNNLDA